MEIQTTFVKSSCKSRKLWQKRGIWSDLSKISGKAKKPVKSGIPISSREVEDTFYLEEPIVRRFQIHIDRRLLNDCDALSHQVKSEFRLSNSQRYFQFLNSVTPYFPCFQWLLFAAKTVEIWIPLRNAWWTRLETASDIDVSSCVMVSQFCPHAIGYPLITQA